LATETERAGALGEQLQRVEAQDTADRNGINPDAFGERRKPRHERSRGAQSR
jgi:hypothetical protein